MRIKTTVPSTLLLFSATHSDVQELLLDLLSGITLTVLRRQCSEVKFGSAVGKASTLSMALSLVSVMKKLLKGNMANIISHFIGIYKNLI